MKKNLSLIFSVVLAVSGMVVNNETVYAAEQYQNSYGEQLSLDDNSKNIYDKMVEAYIYQVGDAGNEDGKYTGMAQVVNASTRQIQVDVAQYSYKINVAGMTSAQIDMERENIIQTATNDLMADVLAAFDSFVKDYPEVYWLYNVQTSIKYKAITFGTNMTVSISNAVIVPSEYVSGMSGKVTVYNEAVIATKEKIKKEYSISDKSSEVDIAKAIHDYLALKLEYNYNAVTTGVKGNGAYAYTSMPAFLDCATGPSVVCEGYAKAFSVLCNQFGIENAIISGVSVNNSGKTEGHMWNQVKLADKWYAVDVTWDDQTGKVYYNYFLAGRNSKGFKYTFEKDHIADTKFSNSDYSMTYILPSLESEGHILNGITPMVIKNASVQNTVASDSKDDKDTNKTTTVAKKKVSKVSIKKAKFSKIKTQKYKKGKACKPKIKVTYNGKKLKKNKDYTVTYKNNKKKGTAKIIIKGKGKYNNKKVIKFKIK